MDALRFFTRGLPPPPMATVGHHHQLPSPAVHVAASAAPRADPSDAAATAEGRREGSWVLKILRVNSLWARGRQEEAGKDDASGIPVSDTCPGCCGEGCGFGGGDEPEGPEEEEDEDESLDFDRSKFSKLLRRVSMVELEVYAKLSYLGILAYNIPKIKPVSLLKHHGLRFVTSSLEKKAQSTNAEKEQLPETDMKQNEPSPEAEEDGQPSENGLNRSAVYDIAASAASYLQSQTRSILPFRNRNADKDRAGPDRASGDQERISSSDVASFVATTNSVTAVVAGKKEMKEAVAKDLNSAQSTPCEWFICDDDKSCTRYFVIQGSESIASWQANLLFEPIQFEGMDVMVHRGIYEAAKGIYQQMLPEVRAHLESRGSSATLRFTGHSLGGSLSLLVNLMLLIRGEAPLSSLLPVITFGAPTILCGGDYLLRKLGLPESHVQAITMHRDIVPRAFSCNYPDNVATILKAVNGNFRNHPCLNHQKLLYAPMGKLLILQPEEKFSPYHDFLPPGSGLYLLDHSSNDLDDPVRLLRAARTAFLNTPHPLEILSDRSAYGSEGTIYRDHDIQSYVRSVRRVFRQEVRLVRRAKRERRRLLWWPIVATDGGQPSSSAALGQRVTLAGPSRRHFSFVGVLDGGRETLKRCWRMFASRNLHMFIVFLFPARLLLVGTISLIKLG